MAAARCRQPRCRVAEGAIEPLLPDRGQKKIMKRCCVRGCNSKSNCSLTGVPVPVPARAAQRRVLCPCWPRAATRSRRRGQSIWRQGRRTRWQHPAAAEQHGRSVRASMRRMADLCDVAVLMAGRAHVLVVARARSGAATRGQWCDHSLSLHTCACGGRAAPHHRARRRRRHGCVRWQWQWPGGPTRMQWACGWRWPCRPLCHPPCLR